MGTVTPVKKLAASLLRRKSTATESSVSLSPKRPIGVAARIFPVLAVGVHAGDVQNVTALMPFRRKNQNSSSYDKLMTLQEEIMAALPEEKRPLMDSVHDEINKLLMDEGESAFIEGVTFGIRVMMEVGGE